MVVVEAEAPSSLPARSASSAVRGPDKDRSRGGWRPLLRVVPGTANEARRRSGGSQRRRDIEATCPRPRGPSSRFTNSSNACARSSAHGHDVVGQGAERNQQQSKEAEATTVHGELVSDQVVEWSGFGFSAWCRSLPRFAKIAPTRLCSPKTSSAMRCASFEAGNAAVHRHEQEHFANLLPRAALASALHVDAELLRAVDRGGDPEHRELRDLFGRPGRLRCRRRRRRDDALAAERRTHPSIACASRRPLPPKIFFRSSSPRRKAPAVSISASPIVI